MAARPSSSPEKPREERSARPGAAAGGGARRDARPALGTLDRAGRGARPGGGLQRLGAPSSKALEAEARAMAQQRAEACAALGAGEPEAEKRAGGRTGARERDLGQAPVGSREEGVATGKHKPAPWFRKAPPPSPRSEPPGRDHHALRRRRGRRLAAASPPQVTDSVDLAFDALIQSASSSTDSSESALVDEPLFDDQVFDLDLGTSSPPRRGARSQDDELASFLSVDRAQHAGHAGARHDGGRERAMPEEDQRPRHPCVGGTAGFVLFESSIADGRVGYEQFSKKIKFTTRLMPTEALQTRKPSKQRRRRGHALRASWGPRQPSRRCSTRWAAR